MLKYFQYAHLPARLQAVSRRFYELAQYIDSELPACTERSVALRKLLEGKDAAVRAALDMIEKAPQPVVQEPAKEPAKAPRPKKQKLAYSVKEFCAVYGVSNSTMYSEAAAKRLKLTKLGRRTLIGAEDAKAWWDLWNKREFKPSPTNYRNRTKDDTGLAEVLKS